jgi:hypothetical protein
MRAARSFMASILLSVVFAGPASAFLMLSVEPSSPAAGDSVTLFISGFDSCPAFRDAELASGVASVFYRPVGCLAPPGPFTERIPLGALPAGDYLVQVLFLDGTKVDRLEFRVNRAIGNPACVPDAVTLCLRGGRFKVQATLDSPGLGSFSGENALARPMSFQSGMLYFFSSGNAELFVKVLDGCWLNGHHWLFVAGLTNLGATLRVTDTKTGEQKVIQNPAGASFASLQDTAAFGSCPE